MRLLKVPRSSSVLCSHANLDRYYRGLLTTTTDCTQRRTNGCSGFQLFKKTVGIGPSPLYSSHIPIGQPCIFFFVAFPFTYFYHTLQSAQVGRYGEDRQIVLTKRFLKWGFPGDSKRTLRSSGGVIDSDWFTETHFLALAQYNIITGISFIERKYQIVRTWGCAVAGP